VRVSGGIRPQRWRVAPAGVAPATTPGDGRDGCAPWNRRVMRKIAISLGVFGVFLVIGITWRLASGRRSLPCPVWLRWFVELDNPFTRTNRAATIIEHLELEPNMAVLDLGCGPGRVAVPLAERVPQGEVAAVDIQEGMLKRAKEKAEKAHVSNIRFVQAGAGEGNLGRDRFDRALLVAVLGEIPDQRAALQEIFDALKTGGILSVTEVIFDPHFQSCSKVTRLAEAVGFREHRFFGTRLAFTLNLQKPAA
jgi:SAM-dependent methyltransferase